MAYYGRKTDTEPRLTGKACEICGNLPERRLHKHADANITHSIQSHAQNRHKIVEYFALRVNRPDLVNKMACSECIEKYINEPYHELTKSKWDK